MGFTTQIFLFVFFPICLLPYIIIDRISAIKSISWIFEKLRVKDIIIIVFSLGFYMWSSVNDLFRLLLYILIVYLFGFLIQAIKTKKVNL